MIFIKNSSNSSNFVLPPRIDAYGLKFNYTLRNVTNKILNLSNRDDIAKFQNMILMLISILRILLTLISIYPYWAMALDCQ